MRFWSLVIIAVFRLDFVRPAIGVVAGDGDVQRHHLSAAVLPVHPLSGRSECREVGAVALALVAGILDDCVSLAGPEGHLDHLICEA